MRTPSRFYGLFGAVADGVHTAVSPTGSVGASAFGRCVHRTPAPHSI
ncbi:MAG: hypothetical protein IKI29_03030 [Clostridia bacterium]|nr:hypothetical protein [Clostridia bacterium]